MSNPLDPQGSSRAHGAHGAEASRSHSGGSLHWNGGFAARAPRRWASQEASDGQCTARDLLAPLRRAVDLHLRGDYEGAEQRLRAVLERAPELPQAHHHLAVVLHSQGKTVQSVRHLRHAIALDPHLPGAEERLERYLSELK